MLQANPFVATVETTLRWNASSGSSSRIEAAPLMRPRVARKTTPLPMVHGSVPIGYVQLAGARCETPAICTDNDVRFGMIQDG